MSRINGKRINLPAAVLLAVIVGMVAYTTRANRNAAQAPPTAAATVNIETVFESVNQRSDADSELKALAEKLDEEGDRRREEIDRLREDQDIFPPGSAQHDETRNAIARKSYELNAYLDFAMRKLEVEKARKLREIYRELKTAVRIIAEERGLDFVYLDETVADLPTDVSEVETWRQISARRMLYANPEVDITNEVISLMNR